MVPSDFSPFFVATAGAAAALVGLLFIAVSIAPERIAGPHAPIERRLVASAVFGFLSDTFFVSLTALIPGIDIGLAVIIMGVLYLVTFVPSALVATFRVTGTMRRIRRGTLPLTATVMFGWQILIGINLARAPTDTSEILAVPLMTLVMLGISLIRAWELLGASRMGLFARLSPLIDVEDQPAQSQGTALPPPSDTAPASAADEGERAVE